MYQDHATFKYIFAVLNTFISYSCKLALELLPQLLLAARTLLKDFLTKLVRLIVKFSLGIGF